MLGKGKYRDAFLQAVFQKANDYPFLKIFRNEHSNRERLMKLMSRCRLDEIVFGVSDVLDQSVSFISTPKTRTKLKEPFGWD